MSSTEARQRKPPTKEATELQKQSTKPPTEPGLKHGIGMQILRSMALATWFNSCMVLIFITQLVGCPLYLINKGWYYSYMAYTKQNFGLVITALTEWGSPTLFRVSGDASIRGQVHLSEDGMLQTDFPERLVMIANHQIYTDWIYLWWFAYTNVMHGRIFIILKDSLKWIPIMGQGMMFYGFIFLARKWLSDKARIEYRLQKLKTKYMGTKSNGSQYDPMWLLIFPEGTNLSINTKRRSDAFGEKQGLAPLKHQVLPRSTGLFFCLQQLRGTVEWVYDSTIAYEGPPYVSPFGFPLNHTNYSLEMEYIPTSSLLSALRTCKDAPRPRLTCIGDDLLLQIFLWMTSQNLKNGCEPDGLRKICCWTNIGRRVDSRLN